MQPRFYFPEQNSIIDLLDRIMPRIPMYIGIPSITRLKAFVDGWCFRRPDEVINDDFEKFQSWLQKYYQTTGNQLWSDLILSVSEDGRGALNNLHQNLKQWKEEEGIKMPCRIYSLQRPAASTSTGMNSVIELLDLIKANPVHYLGKQSLSLLEMFTEGWHFRRPYDVADDDSLIKFHRWVQRKYKGPRNTSWAHIILLNSKGEYIALNKFCRDFEQWKKSRKGKLPVTPASQQVNHNPKPL